MKAKQPPRLGMVVLQRLGPQNDALAGDLAEEYRAGRSLAWYWWQVLASVVVGATRQLWAQKWLGVQVVAAYVGIQAFLGYVWRFIWFRTPLSSQVQEFSDSVWGPSDPLVNAPYRLISTVAALPVMTCAGWVLAKLSDSQRGAALLLNSVVLVALNVPRVVFLTTMAIEKPAQWMNLYLHLAWLAVGIVGLLAGALMAGSQERPVARLTQ